MGVPGEERSPPLRIVLGALNDGVCPSSTSAPSEEVATLATQTTSSVDAPYMNILGTSYFATPRVGGNATTTATSTRRSVLKLNKDGRVPMEDRKGAFDHLKPKSLVISTIRLTAINISTTISHFFSDQLTSEQKVEEMVESGEITTREADEMNEEWENREWKLRMDALPEKIGWAILRFHANTAVMRWYEFILARYVLKVDSIMEGGGASSAGAASTTNSTDTTISQEQAITIMDKLTRDPFQASKRTSQILHKQEHAPGKVISSSDGKETSTNRELVKRMFSTCIWANIIPFLAELSVQQGVLIYGYVVYYLDKQRRRRRRELAEEERNNNDANEDEDETDEEDVDTSAYALSLVFRSSRLSIARSMSWISASAGGAVGSAIYPGWGTVFGIQVGDAVVGALID